jgi:hypothetical protein
MLNGIVSYSIDKYAQFEPEMYDFCSHNSMHPFKNHFPTYKESKHHYNYLYLDPRVLYVGDPEQELFNFITFVRSIFYVGKGTGDRAMAHLRETRNELNKSVLGISSPTAISKSKWHPVSYDSVIKYLEIWKPLYPAVVSLNELKIIIYYSDNNYCVCHNSVYLKT